MSMTHDGTTAHEYDDLARLMGLMTGDEKHALASTSTLDVLWVLYDRVLDVAPGDRRTTRSATGSSSPRGTARWRTTPCSRPRASSPRSGWPAGRRSTRRSATTRTATWCPAWRSRRARSATACRSPSGPRSACGRRGIDVAGRRPGRRRRARRGQQPRGARAGRRAGPRPAHRRRRRQPVAQLRRAAAGSSSASRPRAGTLSRVDGRDHDALERGPDRTRPRGRPTVVVADGRGGRHDAADPQAPHVRPHRAPTCVDEDPRVALVYAEISGQFFGDAERRHPDRVVNVGIREQLLVNVGAGLALTGHATGRAHVRLVPGRARLRAGQARLRPPGRRRRAGRRRRLVRRVVGRPHAPGARRRRADGHASPACTIHAPGNADEADAVLRRAVADDGLHYVRVVDQTERRRRSPARRTSTSYAAAPGATVVALGPVLDAVLAATEGRDVTVLYAPRCGRSTRRGLRAVLAHAGRGARRALAGRHLGARGRRRAARRTRTGCCRSASAASELRRYGTPRSTSPPTASTPPACAARWTRSSARGCLAGGLIAN